MSERLAAGVLLRTEAEEMIDAANEEFALQRHGSGGDALAHLVLREHFHARVAHFDHGDHAVFAGGVKEVTGENGR